MEKKCFKCLEAKPRSEFYKHPQMGDGLLGKCKSCTKSDVGAHRAKNIEKIRAYDRSRGGRRYLVGALEYGRQYKKRFPLRWAAQMAIQREKRRGNWVPKPCSKCGEKANAHHEDYRKPLDVIWLCTAHHRMRHAEIVRLGIDLHG